MVKRPADDDATPAAEPDGDDAGTGLAEKVDSLVAMFGRLLDDGKAAVVDTAEGDDDGDAADEPPSPRRQEQDAYHTVRRLMDMAENAGRSRAEDETAERMKALAEQPPKAVRKLTRFMWGSE